MVLRLVSPWQVWRQMLSLGLQPSRHGYNLLLEAARDCGLGDPEVASALLLRPREEMVLLQPRAGGRQAKRKAQAGMVDSMSAKLNMETLERQLFLEPSKALERPPEPQEARVPSKAQPEMETKVDPDHTVALASVVSELPPQELQTNLLTLGPVPSAVVSFGTMTTSADRLALMGGLEGFLGKMSEHGLRPDIKTLTLLAEVVDPDSPAESSLLTVLDTYQVEADVTFFNTLMRKKSKLGDLEGAKVSVEAGTGLCSGAFLPSPSSDLLTVGHIFPTHFHSQWADCPEPMIWAWPQVKSWELNKLPYQLFKELTDWWLVASEYPYPSATPPH